MIEPKVHYGLACRAVAILSLVLSPLASAGEPARYTLSVGMDYSSGKYGDSDSTEIWYAPVRLKYESGQSTVKLVVPYLRITAPTGGTLVGYDDNGQPVYSGTGTRATAEGPGDVVLSYTYSLFEKPRNNFLVDLIGKVKFATADEKKGLGSGKNDYSVLVDGYYLTGALTPFATVGYRVLGEPAGVDLRDVWQATLGAAYKFSRQNNVGAMWDWRQSSTRHGDNMRELTVYWLHKTTGGFKFQTYGMAGFSDSSPDYGLGLNLSYVTE